MKKKLTINTDPISRMVNEYRAFFAQNTFETYMNNGKEIVDMLWIPNEEMNIKRFGLLQIRILEVRGHSNYPREIGYSRMMLPT